MKKQSKTSSKLPKISELPGWHEDHQQPGTFLQPIVQTPFTVKTKKEFNLSPRYAKDLKLPPIFYSTPRDKTYQKIEEYLLESKIYEIRLPEAKTFDKSISACKSIRSLSSLSIAHDSDISKAIKSNDEQQNSSGLPLCKTTHFEILKENSQQMVLNHKFKVNETNKSPLSLRHLQNNDSPCSLQDISGFNPPKSPSNLQDTLKISEDGDCSQVSMSNQNYQIHKSFSSAVGPYICPGSLNSIGSLNISEDSAESGTRYAGSSRQFSNISPSKGEGVEVVEGRKDYKEMLYNQSGEFIFGKKGENMDNEDMERQGRFDGKKDVIKMKASGDRVKVEDKKKEDVRGREGIGKMDEKKEDKKIDEEKNRKFSKVFKEEDKSPKNKVNSEVNVPNTKNQEPKIKIIEKTTVKTKSANDNQVLKNTIEEEKKSLKLSTENKKDKNYKEDKKDRSKILKEVEDDKKDKNKQISKTIEKNKKLQEDKNFEKNKKSKTLQEELKSHKSKAETKAKEHVPIEKPKKILTQEQTEKSNIENLDTAETPQKKSSLKLLKAKSQSLENQKKSNKTEKPDNSKNKDPTIYSKPNNKAKIKKKSSKSSDKSISSSDDNQESSENDYENNDIQEIIEELSSDEDMEEVSEISFELQKSSENSPDPLKKTQPSKVIKKTQNPTSKTSNLIMKTEGELSEPKSSEEPLSILNTLQQKQITITKSPLQSTKPKRTKSKKNPKQASKTKRKRPKKVQLYNVEGQDVVISIMNEDRKSPEFLQTDENPSVQVEPPPSSQSSKNNLENSLSLLSPNSDTPKASLLSTQGTLGTLNRSSSTSEHNLLDFKRNSSKILNFHPRGPKKDPIKSFISNFSIALLETINQIAKIRPKSIVKPPVDTSKSLNQSSYGHNNSPAFQHKQLEKALNALKIDNDYEDEGKDSVNDLPQNYIPKLYTSYSLLIPNNKPEPQSSPLTQRPTLVSSPTKLSDKYKNVSKFYSKKTEYEKIPSLLSKFSTIQKIPTNGTLKNAHSDSDDSDDFTSSLDSESESIDYRRSDYLKNSALYEVENFELIKNLANTIYGANLFERSGNNSRTPSARSSILAMSEEVLKALKDCENDKVEAEIEESIEESFEKEADRNELNIVFEQGQERYLFFKQDSIKFKVPKMELNTEKLIMENELDIENKRRMELKNQFLTNRPYHSDSDDSEEYTFIKIIPAEENIADKLKFDKKSIQKALQRIKSHPKQSRFALIK